MSERSDAAAKAFSEGHISAQEMASISLEEGAITQGEYDQAAGKGMPGESFLKVSGGKRVINTEGIADTLTPPVDPATEDGLVNPQSYFGKNANPRDIAPPNLIWTPPQSPETKTGSFFTTLKPEEEAQFQQWVMANKIPFDPSPVADYDMKGFWKALQSGDPKATQAGNGHFPDTWKTPYHETFSNESIYATAGAPHWEGYKLIDNRGVVLKDETPPESMGNATGMEPLVPELVAYAMAGPLMRGAMVGAKALPGFMSGTIGDLAPSLAAPELQGMADLGRAGVKSMISDHFPLGMGGARIGENAASSTVADKAILGAVGSQAAPEGVAGKTFEQLKREAIDRALGINKPREVFADAARAVKLKDGGVLQVPPDFPGDHADMLNRLGVGLDGVESIGWVRDGKYVPKNSPTPQTPMQRFMADIKSSTPDTPQYFTVKKAEDVSANEISMRANTALKAISPHLDTNTSLSIAVDRLVGSGASPAAVADMTKNLRMALGRGDRIATRMVAEAVKGAVPENVAGFIRGVASDADVPAVLNGIVDQVGSQLAGVPMNSSRARVAAIQELSKRMAGGEGSGTMRAAVKEYVENMGFVNPSSKSKILQYAPINPKIKNLSELGIMKDFSMSGAATTDLERVANSVDPSGILSTEVSRPLMEGEVRSIEATDAFINSWKQRFPGLDQGTDSSAVLQRFVEGRLNSGEAVTPEMQKAAGEMRSIYNDFLTQVNGVRLKIGKDTIPFREDFATHFKELSVIDKAVGLLNASNDLIKKAADFAHPNAPFFRSALERLGGKFDDDAVGGLFRYVGGANKVIHLTQPISNLRVNSRFLPDNARQIFNWFADSAAGKQLFDSGITGVIDNNPIVKFMAAASNRMVSNLVGGSVGTVLRQTGSLPFVATQSGLENTLRAMGDLLDPEMRAFADRMSLSVRSRISGTELTQQGTGAVGNAINYPLRATDENISKLAFFAGLRKAKENGMQGQFALDFADSVANRSNVLYLKSNTPLILRSNLMKALMPLQTFTLNAGNFLLRDLAIPLAKGESGAVAKAATFGATALALDGIYHGIKELTGVNVGLPVDFRDFVPFLYAFRTGNFGLPAEAAKDISSGNYSRLAYRTIPPYGGVALERLMKGELLPKFKKK